MRFDLLGEVAFALTLVSAVLSFVVVVITIQRFFKNTAFPKFLACFSAFFAFLASVTAFCNWHVNAALVFRDNAPGTLGPFPLPTNWITYYEYCGFNVVVVGWVFSLLTFTLHIATPTDSSAGPSTPDAPNQKF